MSEQLTPEQIFAQCKDDLKEIKACYGSWDELRKVIDALEESEWEEYGDRQYEGDGNFADNH